MSNQLITLAEYNRVFQVAHGVLKDSAKSEKACIFFGCFGAMVLNKHFGIPARAVAGGFALCLSDKPDVAFFGQKKDDRITSTSSGFHMWVLTESHIIDFMSPIFPETFSDSTHHLSIPRKMFQRHKDTEANTGDELLAEGNFLTLPNPKLTELMIDNFLRHEKNTDLLLTADEWFGKRAEAQQRTFSMENKFGEVFNLSLSSTVAAGSW